MNKMEEEKQHNLKAAERQYIAPILKIDAVQFIL